MSSQEFEQGLLEILKPPTRQALPGSKLPWRVWARLYLKGGADRPFADYHDRIWEWGESLRPGIEPPAHVECIFRGGGKSTSGEGVIARQAVLPYRNFCLYVSGTQDAANGHVQTIGNIMERAGVSRAVNKYNLSKGWTASKLRTANGFNVLAAGLDAALRGIKFDEFRPDIIVLDDFDSLGDSPEAADKKFRTIVQSILLAGSTDVAVLAIQNAMHQHSIMQGLLDGTRPFLRRRNKVVPVPAIEGMEWEEFKNAAGLNEVRITAGRATWAGKPLEACEAEINRTDIIGFLRECQHDVGAGGRFFRDWNAELHCMTQGEDGRLYQAGANPVQIEKRWTFWGGNDWGYGAPFCFLLNTIDERDAEYTIDEIYQAHKTDDEQADAIVALLNKWDLPLDSVIIYADPQMWAEETDHTGKRFQRVNAFLLKGLVFVKAIPANTKNYRKAGWSVVRQGLRNLLPLQEGEARQFPVTRIVANNCPNLVRTMPLQVYSKTDNEDTDTKAEDHAPDVLRFIRGAKTLSPLSQPSSEERAKARRQEQWRKELFDDSGPQATSW